VDCLKIQHSNMPTHWLAGWLANNLCNIQSERLLHVR
jgi:hypothetical protein